MVYKCPQCGCYTHAARDKCQQCEINELRAKLTAAEEVIANIPCHCTREVDDEFNWIGQCDRCKALAKYEAGG